jgi:hypothetical protein
MATPKTVKSVNPNAISSEERNVYKEFNLPSGKKCIIKRFKGKHVQQAQRLMNSDLKGEDFGDCLAAMLVEIDGKPVIKEDLPEMDGVDYLKMINPINQLFT